MDSLSVITLVFTDIQGSSVLWEAAPDAVRQGLKLHDALMRERIEAGDKDYGPFTESIVDAGRDLATGMVASFTSLLVEELQTEKDFTRGQGPASTSDTSASA